MPRHSAPDVPGAIVLLTGLSGAGKTTIAQALAARLWRRTTVLDGDEMRTVLSAGLGFSADGRATHVRRVGWVATRIAEHGGLVLCALIAPSAAVRREVRDEADAAGVRFALVHVATPLEVCEGRDVKGHYARARAGTLASFTGVSDAYEPPTDADVTLTTDAGPDETASRLAADLVRLGVLRDEDLPQHDRPRQRARADLSSDGGAVAT